MTTKSIEVTTVQKWADRINGRLGQAVSAIIAVGLALHQAKRELPHGEWARLFQGQKDAISKPIRFSLNTAQRLAREWRPKSK